MRLARAGCGDIPFWMGLPVYEVLSYMLELIDQLEAEQQAAEEAAKKQR